MGKTCKVTKDCRECGNSKPCADQISQPRSGEQLTECYKCWSGKQTINGAEVEGLGDDYKGWTAPSGCKCEKGCELKGTCCQSWYQYGCAYTGTPEAAKAVEKNHLKAWRPHLCTAAQCGSREPIVSATVPSFFCYCHADCGYNGQDDASGNWDQCCDGE